MRVVEERLKGSEGEIKLIPESVEDLWHLKYIIEPGDVVFSLTKRASESSDKLRSDKQMVTVRLGIQVERVEFHKFANRLRITGRIVAGVEDSGYHTLNITEGKELSIIKERWSDEQLERIKTAVESSNRPEVLILTIEEGEASLGILRQWGVDEVAVVKGSYGKDRGNSRREFFGEVYSVLKGYDFGYLVIAGPGFTKNDFYEFLKEKDPEMADKAILTDTSSIGVRGFLEVLKRGVVDRIVGELRIKKDAEYMDMLLEEIAKDGKAVYGIDEVKRAYEYGALEVLLVADEFLRQEREKWDIDSFLRDVENMGAKVVIMSSEFEPGKRLMALGGIAGLLRFSIG
ncbi:mRNA surveillance protein pelota [Geoglobus ahangari]|uniref:Protein pelota homolog n=1 Tax=Geoglobus ahangari TaxID=113653 RepID=A0A0F7IJ79_9EURY|nr:mRNA surveillance protein pelota [Geoglobus ahangari]AKG92288.1 mRNA surveillance protein pelota [Geoglobus ahangari]NOY11883.1 mRNA surveillance protein pelota [Archaeoglobi archaeon]